MYSVRFIVLDCHRFTIICFLDKETDGLQGRHNMLKIQTIKFIDFEKSDSKQKLKDKEFQISLQTGEHS